MDDKLPKCGCGGEARTVVEDAPDTQQPEYMTCCLKCGANGGYRETREEAEAIWTRAMSAQAPGMEAMREALRKYCIQVSKGSFARMRCLQCGFTWNTVEAEIHAPSCPAALQAAERGKA